METIEIIDEFIKKYEAEKPVVEKTSAIPACHFVCTNNVVANDKLHDVQASTLQYLKDCLANTYGPMGSYTMIIKGNDAQTTSAEYSKDGMKVLKNIVFGSPIEMSIQSEILEITRYVESKVGDGTTSAVILSSLIYDGLKNLMDNESVPPRMITQLFKKVIDAAKESIELNKKDVTVDDIYKISMISTNGNEDISRQIKYAYEKYGLSVTVDVGISNDDKTKIKSYDGLTINEGYSDPAYINNIANGTSDIYKPSIYAFQDPIDTPEMVSFFEKIIYDNILEPVVDNSEMVPTVILAPKITRDASGILTELVSNLYKYNEKNLYNQKPPILIITNISGTDEDIYLDIARLCNCKYIKKYIDPAIQQREIENGKAPTLDTIHDFAGTAELVVADASRVKFINPYDFTEANKTNYNMLINFLKSEIQNAIDLNDDNLTIGRLKKRLKCLESNMIEFLVGGISVSDRDALRDLVEDAVKNCASAVEYGYGRAANFEGLFAFDTLNTLYEEMCKNDEVDKTTLIKKRILAICLSAYIDASAILYGTVRPDAKYLLVKKSLQQNTPYDVGYLFEHSDDCIDDLSSGRDVICSIKTDVEILDAISKIITIMVTSNQCLLQSTALNRY